MHRDPRRHASWSSEGQRQSRSRDDLNDQAQQLREGEYRQHSNRTRSTGFALRAGALHFHQALDIARVCRDMLGGNGIVDEYGESTHV